MSPTRSRLAKVVLASIFAVSLIAQSWAEQAPYRVVDPPVGDPFELADRFTTIEPVVAGSDDPLPGWAGSGHMIVLDDGRLL